MSQMVQDMVDTFRLGDIGEYNVFERNNLRTCNFAIACDSNTLSAAYSVYKRLFCSAAFYDEENIFGDNKYFILYFHRCYKLFGDGYLSLWGILTHAGKTEVTKVAENYRR